MIPSTFHVHPVQGAPLRPSGLSILLALIIALVAGLSLMPAAAARAADAPCGQELFQAQKCQLCHAVPAAGIEAKTKSEKVRGPDLGTVKTLRPAPEVVAFLLQKGEIEGERHNREFKGSDEELQALVDWLLELSKAAKAAKEGGGTGAAMP